MPQNSPLLPVRTTLNTLMSLALLLVLLPILYLSVGCSVAAGGAVDSSVQKQQAALATGVVPPQFFGMVVKNQATQPTVATGARRLWDSGVTWAALEPAQGGFQWATLDAEVSAAQQARAEVTLTLGMTPQWASSQPGSATAYGAGATSMPADLANWDAYVTAVATRYQGRIAAYEVWNAPEDPASWSGAGPQMGEDMATLASRAASTIHAADSAARVISPALSPTGLAAFLSAGGGASVDIIGSSLGSDTANVGSEPESMAATLQGLRTTMAGTEAEGKPIWNDQSSWALPQGGLSVDMQAAYVARALLLNAGYAVERIHWYAWDEQSTTALALIDSKGQPTAAARAFSTVESWIAGAQMNGCAATAGGLWTCQIVRDGRTEWVLWSTTGTVQSSTLGAQAVTDLEGNVSSLSGTDVSVGVSPVLLQ